MMMAGQEEVSAAGGIISWLARPHLSLVPRVCVLFCFNCFIRFRRRRHGQRGTHGQRGEANPCSHPSITRSTPSIHNSRTQGRTRQPARGGSAKEVKTRPRQKRPGDTLAG